MIEDLLKFGGPQLLIPILIVTIGVALVKGLFGVHRSKSADRKDFLDLWSRRESLDDVWLEVAVRHLFGVYLPASLIRSLLQSPQAARAILEVSDSWDFLDMDDETKELSWKNVRHRRAKSRRREAKILSGVYFFAMGIALYIAYMTLTTQLGSLPAWVGWVYTLLFGGLAFWCLSRSDSLKAADKAAPRWLGIP